MQWAKSWPLLTPVRNQQGGTIYCNIYFFLMHMFYNDIRAYIHKYNSATWITPSGFSNCEVKDQIGMALVHFMSILCIMHVLKDLALHLYFFLTPPVSV